MLGRDKREEAPECLPTLRPTLTWHTQVETGRGNRSLILNEFEDFITLDWTF